MIPNEYQTAEIRPLTRGDIAQRRQERDQGYWFELPMTGGYALVRIPNIADRVFMASLPDEIQQIIAQSLVQENASDAAAKVRSAKEAMNYLVENITKQEKLANNICARSFLKPRLVLDEHDVDEHDEFCDWVGNIHIDDRVAFLELVIGGEREAARKLSRFRDGPMAPVSDQSGNQAAATPIGISGAA